MVSDIYDFNESLEVEEYLARIPDVLLQERIDYILRSSVEILGWINNSMGKNIELPEIRIITNPSPNAEAISYVIRLNSGLIDHCLNSLHADFETVFGRTQPETMNSDKIAIVSLSWILAHEWTHILRCHDDVIKELGDDPSILQALEHDADFCAIATVYRKLQSQYFHELSDTEIKETLIYCLFWTVRTLPSMSNTHEDIGMRLNNFIFKLSTIAQNPYEEGDYGAEKPETIAIALALVQVMVKCEKYFQTINTDDRYKANLFEKIVKNLSDDSYVNTTMKWTKVKEIVGRVSKTRATE